LASLLVWKLCSSDSPVDLLEQSTTPETRQQKDAGKGMFSVNQRTEETACTV
jgi:hypothetical protein